MEHERLSRTEAHALRHEPRLYELDVDGEGRAPVEQLVYALRAMGRQYVHLPVDRATALEVGRRKARERGTGRRKAG